MNNYFAAAFGRLPRWTTSWEITTSYDGSVLTSLPPRNSHTVFGSPAVHTSSRVSGIVATTATRSLAYRLAMT